jgi:glycosyltransferase involved in cell wall biosynthesis
VYYLARTQAELGHDVAIFSINDKPPIPVPGCEVKSYPVRRFPLPFRSQRLQDLLRYRSPLNLPPALTADLLAWQPTIVHFHFVHLPQAIRLAHRLRKRAIPYCVTPNGGLSIEAQQRHPVGKSIFGWLFERRYLDKARFIHAVSAADVEGVKAYGAHNRFVTAPNCIDPSLMPREVDRNFARQQMPEIAGRRLFLFLGRLDPDQKGLDMLLTAWSGLPTRDSLALLLVGPDWRQGRSRLQALVDTLGITDSVKFFGSVSGNEKWDLLASADVFVHPSRWEAGVAFSVLEAMVAAKPLLLTTPADPDGLVVDSEACVVVSADAESIGSGLASLADADAAELENLGLAARTLVVDQFSWKSTAERLLDSYQNAVLPRDH